MSGRGFKVPHTLVLLFAMIVLAWLATLVVPAGSYDLQDDGSGHAEVVPGSFSYLPDATPPSFWNLFTVIPRGLAASQGIIFFVMIIGGALSVLRATGAVDAGMRALLARLDARPVLLIFIAMLAFAVGSSTIGMAEEYIPLTAVLLMLCVAMRMDPIAAIGIMVIGYGVGFGTATINPFTVLVAQGVAGVEPVSGLAFRLAMFVPFFAAGFWYVTRYAVRVRADASRSLMHDIETTVPDIGDAEDMTVAHRIVLGLVVLTLVLLVWGIKQKGWYFIELGGVFLALGLVVGLVGRLSLDTIAEKFMAGAGELAGTAMLIGFARSIELMLTDGQVLHTIINALAVPLEQIGGAASAVGMLAIQSVLNFFVPSGSGQAYVTMPIMAPLADLVGVSRQVAVLAYQMGDGFMNMVVPTNAVLMGILGIAGIPYSRWLKFIGPFIGLCFVLGSLTLVIAVQLGV
ncbi:MAG: TIGR00366 family protein [Pseudomonadota bacterium]